LVLPLADAPSVRTIAQLRENAAKVAPVAIADDEASVPAEVASAVADALGACGAGAFPV